MTTPDRLLQHYARRRHSKHSPSNGYLSASILAARMRGGDVIFIVCFISKRYYENKKVDHQLGDRLVRSCLFYLMFGSINLQTLAVKLTCGNRELPCVGIVVRIGVRLQSLLFCCI